MSEAKHTPGPWRVTESRQMGNRIEGQSGRPLYEGDDGWRTVASFQDCCPSTDYEVVEGNAAANGLLIATAPELLAACKDALAFVTTQAEDDEYPCTQREAATGAASGSSARTKASPTFAGAGFWTCYL